MATKKKFAPRRRAATVIHIGRTFSQESSLNNIEGGFFEGDRYVAVRR
jgi:hypothetical protein